jgi:hypothetical protein
MKMVPISLVRYMGRNWPRKDAKFIVKIRNRPESNLSLRRIAQLVPFLLFRYNFLKRNSIEVCFLYHTLHRDIFWDEELSIAEIVQQGPKVSWVSIDKEPKFRMTRRKVSICRTGVDARLKIFKSRIKCPRI